MPRRRKAEGAFLSIGEVTETTGIAPHILRYWEQRLAQLRPVKRAGGRRYYRPEDVALVRRVQQLIEREGYTLDGAARVLATRPAAMPATEPAPVVADAARRVDLIRLRDRLVRALAA